MRRKKSFYAFILSLIIVLVLIVVNKNVVKADEDVINALRKEIKSIKTVEVVDDFSDLIPLKELFEGKKLISMGDATYGTSEFFKMKHRILKFLVEEMGFKALAMDLNFAEGESINKYILNKAGDEESVMNTFSEGIYKTEEVKEMLNWMKEYNIKANDKDKIKFYGFNMKYNNLEFESLKNYLNIVKPEILETYKDKSYFNLDNNKEKVLDITMEEVNNIIKDFEINKKEMMKKSSKEDYESMMKNLEVIKQGIELVKDNEKNRKEAREDVLIDKEKYMANNVKWIVDKEEQLGNNRIMIWSNNRHIMKGNIPGKRFKDIRVKTMGNYLNEIYGTEYYAIGFDFYKGRFNASDLKELKDSERQTLAETLNKIEEPIFYLNITKALTNKEVKKLFDNNSFIKFINGTFDELKETYLLSFDANKDYDGLIFIKETTESKSHVYNIEKHKIKEVKIKNDDYIYENTSKILACIGVISVAILLICFILYKNNKSR